MGIDYEHIIVEHNEGQHRYEARVADDIAELVYAKEGNRIIYLHTGVPEVAEGRGIGSKLVHAALEDARTQGLSVIPACPFVETYIERHPEYQSLVETER